MSATCHIWLWRLTEPTDEYHYQMTWCPLHLYFKNPMLQHKTKNSLTASTFFFSKMTPFLARHIEIMIAIIATCSLTPSFLFFMLNHDQFISSSPVLNGGIWTSHQAPRLLHNFEDNSQSKNK
ncbi:hypothetical protein LXL04_001601 [Taraxacum kok-saghyz]